jgi:hypothetical protein
MKTETPKALQVRIFVGAILSPEIGMQLNQSALWKQSTIQNVSEDSHLIKIPYHGKEFIGYYLPSVSTSVRALHEIEKKIQERIKFYCPGLAAHQLKVFTFPQVFIP